MKTFSLLDRLVFSELRPHMEMLYEDEAGRILRFTLRPGQRIRKYCAPHAPVHILVLKGKGVFAGDDVSERPLSANDLGMFAAGELNSVRALDEDLVFIAHLPRVLEGVTERSGRKATEANAYLTWHM